MSNQQSQVSVKIYYYLGAGAILAGLIALLWFRYAATQHIIRDLGGGLPEARQRAGEELLKRGILADVLPAQPPVRRRRAAGALRAIAQESDSKVLREKAIAQLVTMLKDPDDTVQQPSWMALGKIGVPALPFLRHRDPENKDKDYSVLKEGDARAKQAGMNAYVLMASDAKQEGDPKALQRVLSDLGEAAADADERAAADAVLGDLVIGKEPARIKVPEALEPLLAMAWSEENDNRKAALVALGDRRIPEGAKPALEALEIDDLKQVAIRALGNIGMNDPQPGEVREAVEPIIAQLEDPVVRSDAARALGKIRDPRAVPALAEHLSDLDQELWDSVVGALGTIADAPGATGEIGGQALIAALKADDPRRREGAAAALRGVEAPASVGPLTATLGDPVWSVRAAAAAALGWKENVGAIQPLIATMAREQNWRVVDNAIESLGDIGRPAIAPLISTLGHRTDNEALPLYAERALLKIDATYPKEAGRVLETSLIAATRNQNLDIAKWAAITLGDLGYSKQAAAVLRELRSSPREEVAWVAKEALREMGVEIE